MEGLVISESSDNSIYHNNFVNNTPQIYTYFSLNNWDDGYPSGGNYWSDHVGVDVKSGPGQDLPGGDGISDAPYIIDVVNQDNYPLMSPYEYWSNPIPGDINRDTKVDGRDLLTLAIAYGSQEGEGSYNPAADLDESGKIDWRDLLTLARNYGKTA